MNKIGIMTIKAGMIKKMTVILIIKSQMKTGNTNMILMIIKITPSKVIPVQEIGITIYITIIRYKITHNIILISKIHLCEINTIIPTILTMQVHNFKMTIILNIQIQTIKIMISWTKIIFTIKTI